MAASIATLRQEPTPLVIKSEIPVGNEKAMGFIMPVVTDADGNIYLRYSDGQHRADEINKISPSGKKLFSLHLARVPELSGSEIVDFSVSSGKLLVLARHGTGIIATFDLSGSFLSSNRIKANLEPLQIAALGSSGFVVAGRVPQIAADWTPEVTVLDPSGRMVKTVTLERDVAPVADKQTNANGAVRRDKEFQVSLVASRMITGDDGNVYLMRYGKSGAVFVIAPNGTVVHRFTLEMPPNTLLKDLKVAENKMAALIDMEDAHSEVVATFVRIYDADSGRLLSDYRLDPKIPDLLAAYDGKVDFTFIGPEVIDEDAVEADQAGRLRIFSVGPR
jgi:hypothetical protein